MKMPFKTLQEVIDYAIEREEDSAFMYLELAKKMENPEISNFLKKLAEEEFEHKKRLQFESLKIGKTVNLDQTIDYNLPDEFKFDDVNPIDISYGEALVMAMKKEEIAFKLYTELATIAENGEVKQALLELAQEEVKHKLRFQVEYDKYTQQ